MADIVSRIYNNFRGVDFRGNEVNLLRSPDSLNMWKDYKHTESIRTRPGLDLITSFEDAVYGIFFYKNTLIVHSGKTLFMVKNNIKPIVLHEGLNEVESQGFVYNYEFYLIDGKNYLKYNEDESKMIDVVGYIPTTTIARKPMGGGTKYEDVNMLSDYRKNSFLADGVSFSYFLDVMNIDEDYAPEVTIYNRKNYYEVESAGVSDGKAKYKKTDTVIDATEIYKLEQGGEIFEKFGETTTGEELYTNGTTIWFCVAYSDEVVSPSEYTVDYKEGRITFKYIPPDAPLTDGQDNVVIKFKKAVPEYEECIIKCSLLQVFDNRVFFSGNPDYPTMIWNSSLNDPSYVSDLDYYKEGMDDAMVTGLVAGNNALWVFREPSESNTTIFYHTPSIDDEFGKIYPSAHSSITTGCIGKAINFNDDIVFFSKRGMEGISGDVTTEQVVAHRSSLVDRKLTAEIDYRDMKLAEWEGYLLVFIGNKVYLADSRAVFTNENHTEYEWFYWELEQVVTCATVKDGVLYIGTNSGIYTLTNENAQMESYWVTPLDKFKNPHKQKTTNKRGCVVEATGDISLFAKLEDTDFELIGTYNNVTDYFVSRIKRKKFKDIQLKFHSNTRFSIETATLECFIGGYIKR